MFTLTGATEKSRENAMLQNIVNFGAKFQTRQIILDTRPTIDDVHTHGNILKK